MAVDPSGEIHRSEQVEDINEMRKELDQQRELWVNWEKDSDGAVTFDIVKIK